MTRFGEFSTRPASFEDVEAVVELLNLCSQRALGYDETSRADCLREWQRPGFELTTASQLMLDAAGQLVGYAQVHDFRAPYTDLRVWLRGIHPDVDGVADVLLVWAEARLRQTLPKAPPHEKVTMQSGINRKYTHVVASLERAGMARIRTFVRMALELAKNLPDPVWPAGITLRTMQTEADYELAFRTIDTAFRDHWGHQERPFEEAFAEWRYRLIESRTDFDPTLQFLAVTDDGQVVGVATNQLSIGDMPDYAWLGYLAVLRDWRKHGLGMALLLHSFQELQRRGLARVALGVDADSPTRAMQLYERAGMTPVMHLDTYEKVLQTGGA